MFRRDERRGGGFKRPCKFWMEKGRWEKHFIRSVLLFGWEMVSTLLWNMILMPWYVSGAKQRTPASIPIPDDRLSFLLHTSCWIEPRRNIYTSLKKAWFGRAKNRLYSTVTHVCLWWPYMGNCDHGVPSDCVNTSWPEPWTLCFLLPLYL